VTDDPRLTLPHPRAHERAFVLVPWLEVDPDAQLPFHGPVRALLRPMKSDAIVPRAG
jgi:2-amino-4-hydroxy-6-hydroxymethyldihydropteridine diphosphokinase